MTEDDFTNHCDLKRLKLGAGDTLVVRVDVDITDQDAKEIKAFWKERFPQNGVIVHGPGIELSVIARDIAETDVPFLRPLPDGLTGKWQVVPENIVLLRELVEESRKTAAEIRKLRDK